MIFMKLIILMSTVEIKTDNFQSIKDLNLCKARVISKHHEGMSIMAISKAVGKNYTTVKRWIQKFNQTGNLEIKKAGGGRPKRITPRVEQFIRNQYSKDKSLTYLQITQRLRKLKKVGKSTIARFCKAHGTKYLPKKQYILSEVNKEKRREYARYLKGGKLADIIWSDESKFDLNWNKKRYFRFKNKPRVGKTVFYPNQLWFGEQYLQWAESA